jgi:hypothetical protein
MSPQTSWTTKKFLHSQRILRIYVKDTGINDFMVIKNIMDIALPLRKILSPLPQHFKTIHPSHTPLFTYTVVFLHLFYHLQFSLSLSSSYHFLLPFFSFPILQSLPPKKKKIVANTFPGGAGGGKGISSGLSAVNNGLLGMLKFKNYGILSCPLDKLLVYR